MTQVKKLGKHAIVIGGSISGLLAGRVLAGHFEQVTVLERDTLPDGPEYRKGAPQARHVHALLTRGGQIMEELFPGLYLQLKEAGAVVADQARDAQMYMYGRYKDRYESGFRSTGRAGRCWST